MYLEYYSIKRFFFFCHFLKNFVIFLILMFFVSFGVVKIHFLKGIGGYFAITPPLTPLKSP